MIKKIYIENFSGIKIADLNIDKNIILFLGENNQGKSSIKNALIWAITGSLPGLKKKDEGSLIHQGTKKTTVRVQIDDRTTERTRTKTKVTGNSLVKENYISVCQLLWSSPWKVFNWFQGKEGQKWLAQRLNPGPTLNEIEQHVGSLPSSIRVTFQKGGLEAAYNEAVNKRREVKRALTELEKTSPPPSLEEFSEEELLKLQEKFNYLKNQKNKYEKISLLKEEINNLPSEEEISKKLEEIKQQLNTSIFVCPILKKSCPVPGVIRISNSNSSSNVQNIQQEKVRLEFQLKTLRRKKTQLEEMEKELGNVDIQKLDKELEEIQEKVIKLNNFQAEKARWEKIQQQKTSLEQEIKLYDSLAKKLNPAEAGKALSKENGLEKVNEMLARYVQFMGFQIKFNNNFELEVVDGIPIIGLSFSEIYRAGVALAITLAELCKIKILMFDDAEVLVQGTQTKFIKWVKTLEAEGYQILVFAASKDKPKPHPAFQIIHVKAGEAIAL